MCEHPDGCEKPVDKDGLCFRHKLLTVGVERHNLKAEREGNDATGGMGTRAFVQDMYAKRRAAGRTDPVPENAEAAKFAPAAGVSRHKKYKEINGGL